MAEKKQIDSHLNKKSKMSDVKVDDKKVQTNNLSEASVKLPCQNYENSTPYSVLANEFVELNHKTVVAPFVVDSAQLAHSEVKLPSVTSDNQANLDLINKVNKVVKKEPVVEKQEVPVEKQNTKLPDIVPVADTVKPKEMSDIELLNNMAQIPSQEEQVEKPKLFSDVSFDEKALEAVKQQEEKPVDALEMLNELQEEKSEESKKSKSVKDELSSTNNQLSDLLKQLEDESGDLGIG